MEYKVFWTQPYQVFSKFILIFCTNINFDSLGLLPSILTSQLFQRISLLCNSVLHSVPKTCTLHTLRSVSTYCLTSLLTDNCLSFSIFLYGMYTVTDKLTSSAWTRTLCIKFNFNPSYFAKPTQLNILKQIRKAMVINYPLAAGQS
jgi:hypothetical protein